MTMKTMTAALVVLFSVSVFDTVTAAPLAPGQGVSLTNKLTTPVHYRGYRHCHRRYGYRHRRCHGGYAYYGYGPSIVLGFGSRRHHHGHFRGFRSGGHHMMHRGGMRIHHR